MEEDPTSRARFRGWVNVLLGTAILLNQAPLIVGLVRVPSKNVWVGGIYNGWVVALSGLSIFSGWTILSRRPRADALTAAAGGAILMNAGYHLIRFGPAWRLFDRYSWDLQLAVFAFNQFAPDLIQGIWWLYCLWTVLGYRSSTDQEGSLRVCRSPRLLAAVAAACSYLANHTLYRWVSEA